MALFLRAHLTSQGLEVKDKGRGEAERPYSLQGTVTSFVVDAVVVKTRTHTLKVLPSFCSIMGWELSSSTKKEKRYLGETFKVHTTAITGKRNSLLR